MVWAGCNSPSFAKAQKSLHQLAELNVSSKQINRLTHQTGQEMLEDRQTRQAAYQATQAKKPLPQNQQTPPEPQLPNPPQVVAVEMDGGRWRARQERSGPGVHSPCWREMKVGCLVRLQSEPTLEDPRPNVPSCFLQRPQVQKLVRQLHSQTGVSTKRQDDLLDIEEILNAEQEKISPHNASSEGSRKTQSTSWRPKRLQRTCVGTQQNAEEFGKLLAAEADSRDFFLAPRKAFLGDGQSCNWTIHQKHFKDFVPIADFVHLVSYVYGFAMALGMTADESWAEYVRWIESIWGGAGGEVLREWKKIAREKGVPESEALNEDDPLRPLQRGLTYLSNNLNRIDYPRYRKLGLPVTSTLVESLIKEYNYRIKGTEKFWNNPSGAEPMLEVCSANLSEDERFDDFFANRPGCRYLKRSTQNRSPDHAQAT